MIAEKNNFKFKFNSYFPIKTINLMRGVFIAEEDNFKNFILIIFLTQFGVMV